MNFTTHGSGPEGVLVLHEWMGDSRNYDAVRPWLDGAAFTYAFADLRGYGASRAMTGDYSVGEIAGDCLALAHALGWARFHIVGHSMTGMVTQRLAVDAPGRIKSAVAVCPVSAAGNKLDAASKAFFASTVRDDAAFRRLIGFVSAGLGAGWAEAKLRANRESVSPDVALRYLDMLTGTDFAAEVQGLTPPFLVLIGDHDPGLDEAAMRRTFLAWHGGAELAVLPSGHYPMQECPPRFVVVVVDFLCRHTAKGKAWCLPAKLRGAPPARFIDSGGPGRRRVMTMGIDVGPYAVDGRDEGAAKIFHVRDRVEQSAEHRSVARRTVLARAGVGGGLRHQLPYGVGLAQAEIGFVRRHQPDGGESQDHARDGCQLKRHDEGLRICTHTLFPGGRKR